MMHILKMQIPAPSLRSLVVGFWVLYFHILTTHQVIFLLSKVWKTLLFWHFLCLLHGNMRKPSIKKVENCTSGQSLEYCFMPSYFCTVLAKLSNAWCTACFMFYFEWPHVFGLFWLH